MPVELPTTKRVHRLAVRVYEARDEMTKVQLELNLQIAELRLKVQPSMPPEVREQCAHAIQTGLEKIGQGVQDCTGMLDQPLTMLTYLQEDPNLQCLET